MAAHRKPGQSIGRVGALAVALGIGSAIVGMPAIAAAEPEGATSQSTGPTGGATVADTKPRSPATRDRQKTSSSEPSGDTVTGPRKKRRPARRPDAGEPTAEPAPAVTAVGADRPAPPATIDEASGPVATPPRSQKSTPLATIVKSLVSPVPHAASDDAPKAPVAAPVLLTMLGASRRQTKEPTTPVRSGVTSSAAPATPAAAVNAAAASPVIPGSIGSPIVGTDGTVYLVTDRSLRGVFTTTVSILGSDGQVVTSRELRGAGGAVARPDGTLVVYTSRGYSIFSRTQFSAVDSQGKVTRLASVAGETSNVRVGVNGDLYFQTFAYIPRPVVGGQLDLATVRISPSNLVRTFPYDTQVALTPDGRATLVSSTAFGANTLRVISASGATRTTTLPFGTEVGSPIVGEDGNVYVPVPISRSGVESTRVYVAAPTTTTSVTIPGVAGGSVGTPDGLFLGTFSDVGSGTSYVSRITAAGVVTSEAIDGRIGRFQVNPDGVVYAPVSDPASAVTPVAVIAGDGSVATVILPGTLVTGDTRAVGGTTHGSEAVGYINYTANGQEYVAVLNPDATLARTIELPTGATGSVFYGPDGIAYELLITRDESGKAVSRQVLTLSTDTATSIVTGTSNVDAHGIVFGPDGTGYLLTSLDYTLPSGDTTRELDVLGFTSAGDAGIRSTGLVNPTGGLTFDGNGVAYVTVYAGLTGIRGQEGVYALTTSGTQRVLDLSAGAGVFPPAPDNVAPPVFGPVGTGYVVVEGYYPEPEGPGPGVVVNTFPSVTVV